jgi:hypothetical protein
MDPGPGAYYPTYPGQSPMFTIGPALDRTAFKDPDPSLSPPGAYDPAIADFRSETVFEAEWRKLQPQMAIGGTGPCTASCLKGMTHSYPGIFEWRSFASKFILNIFIF